jgi:hypothetical protein
LEVFLPFRPGRGHAYPYFKVQARDRRTLAWKDHRREAFDDDVSARAYRANVDPSIETRIVRWDEKGATPLQDSE